MPDDHDCPDCCDPDGGLYRATMDASVDLFLAAATADAMRRRWLGTCEEHQEAASMMHDDAQLDLYCAARDYIAACDAAGLVPVTDDPSGVFQRIMGA